MSKTEPMTYYLSRRVKTLEEVLTLVIAWNVREYGTDGVKQLLDKLHDDIKESPTDG